MAADRVTTGGSRTRTLPPRPLAPPTGPAPRPAKASTGSMVNIAKVGTKVTGRSQEKHRDPDHDIFYSSDSELGGGHHKQVVELDISSSSILVMFRCLQHQVEVKVKRSNSKAHTKPSVAQREFFEQIDSGWTSRDSSSMDRSEYCAVIG